MRKRQKWHAFIAVSVLFAVIACSCGAPDTVSPERSEKIRELGNVMADDLQKYILPYREDPDILVEEGYVLEKGGMTRGADALSKFIVSYEGGKDSEITIVFAKTSFVVARIIFADGNGYYLRYEYKASNPNSISVDGKIIDKVGLEHQQEPPKWRIKLTSGKKEIATFDLKNPV